MTSELQETARPAWGSFFLLSLSVWSFWGWSQRSWCLGVGGGLNLLSFWLFMNYDANPNYLCFCFLNFKHSFWLNDDFGVRKIEYILVLVLTFAFELHRLRVCTWVMFNCELLHFDLMDFKDLRCSRLSLQESCSFWSILACIYLKNPHRPSNSYSYLSISPVQNSMQDNYAGESSRK